ncbi:MAG: response regulator [Proteobacteria bacterium]|nr:response regulator [Pseudomonadota bacterium]MDA1301718.1 response regulator [Pseudomonadota bacterium]
MTPIDLLYTVGFILLFDLIAVGSLVIYYRQLQFPFLRLMAFAVALDMLAQILFFTWVGSGEQWGTLVVVGGVLKTLGALMILAAVAHIVERAVPLFLMLLMLILAVGHSITAHFLWTGINTVNWLLAEVPQVSMFLVAIYYLLARRGSFILHALAGVLSLQIVSKIAMPLLLNAPAPFALTYFFGCLLLIVGALMVLVVASEKVMASLRESNELLQEYRRENQRLELQFTQAQKLESLGALAGGIAHDFNNMLTSMLGYASLAMKKLPPSSEVRKDLYMVISGARQAVDLTSKMLTYAGKGAIAFESMDISRAVDNMSSLINSIVPRKIRVVNNVVRDLPQMLGDPVQVGQIVMNLVANAVDAIDGESGTIEVSTGLTRVDKVQLRQCLFADGAAEGAYLYVGVKDTGKGMAAGQIDRIFDPFYSEKGVSKGLGLSSISGIVRQHRGFVQVVSVPGKGSEFYMYFPVLAYEEGQFTGQVPTRSDTMLRGAILVADDDPRIRSLISSILEGESYRLKAVEDGREAMDEITHHGEEFCLFLLDCTMPKMSGTEVYQQLRSSGSDTPVILISGYHQDQVVRNVGHDEHAYFIKKPFNVDELVRQVEAALAKAEVRQDG